MVCRASLAAPRGGLLSAGLLAEAAYQAVELAGCDCLDATRPTLYVVIVDTLIALERRSCSSSAAVAC